MSTETAPTSGTLPVAQDAGPDTSLQLLEQAIQATRRNETEQAWATKKAVTKDLLKTLIDQAMNGVVKYERNVTVTFERAIVQIEEKIAAQVKEVLRHEKFRKLEGSWRGLHYLVKTTDLDENIRVRFLQVTKKELYRDLTKNSDDQSELFKKVYESGFGQAGGEPFGTLVGDYEFDKDPEDIDMLRMISGVAAASFAPFLGAASADMLGLKSYRNLPAPQDLKRVFEASEFASWRGLREAENSRFISLVMPRVLARAPYRKIKGSDESFSLDEGPLDERGEPGPIEPDKCCWMNGAYVLASKMTESFANSGWSASIRGIDSGGKVENLPNYVFTNDEGGKEQFCPAEIGIADRREAELSALGFIPLVHYKNKDYAAFLGSQSIHKPKKWSTPEADANAALSARLPYLMLTSRIAHYLKKMTRDQIGSYREAENVEKELTTWIHKYCNSIAMTTAEQKAKKPFRNARIKVVEVPGKPGNYSAQAELQPWFQMEGIDASLSLVAELPSKER